MTNPAKAKGDRAELELSRILSDQLGVTVRRKLGAGRMDDTGDLDGLTDTTAQVKNFADVLRGIRETVDALPAQRANAGVTHAVGFVRRPGGRWIAVMDVPTWCTWYREATSC